MTRHLIEVDFANLDQKEHLSYGEKLYVEHGIAGIRGEAATGYPSLAKALDYYNTLHTHTPRHRDLLLLLYLMTFVEDGNLIHRGGIDAYKQVQKEAQQLFEEAQTLTEAQLVNRLEDYDNVLIERNLSPGGSADLLSLTFFCHKIQQNGWILIRFFFAFISILSTHFMLFVFQAHTSYSPFPAPENVACTYPLHSLFQEKINLFIAERDDIREKPRIL